MTKLFFCAVLSLVLVVGSAQSGTTYDLKLGREIRPADHYQLTGFSNRIARVQIREATGTLIEVQNDTTTVRIDAVCEVNAVTEDGQEAIKFVRINSATVTRRGKTTELLPAGTSFKATFSDSGTVFMIDTMPMDPDIAADLVPVIRSEGGKRTSEIMDAKKKVKLGQQWPMNIQAFKRSLDPAAQKTVNKIKGTVKFKSIVDGKIDKSAVVDLHATANNAVSEIQGEKTSSSSIAIDVSVTVPLDGRYPAERTKSKTSMFATFGQGEGSAVVELTVDDDLRFVR